MHNCRKIHKIRFIFLAVLLALSGAAKARAASGFPEIMIGETKIQAGSQTYFGGLGGDFAVFNPDPNSSYGFDKEKLSGLSACQLYGGVTANPLCFFLGTGTAGVGDPGTGRMMTAKTIVDGKVAYELPALFFGGINVNGDVSGNLSYLKFWGKNLYQGNGTSIENKSWYLGPSYKLNPAAQIDWESGKFFQYRDKILTLADSATKLAYPEGIFSTGGDIYLQGRTLADSDNSEASLYPEGKIWVIEDNPLDISGNVRYHGKGTIIVRTSHVRNVSLYPDGVDPEAKGNFSLLADKSLLPYDQNSRLGIMIVNNDPNESQMCDFEGNNKVKVMMLCDGNLTTKGNADMTGSFVAWDFVIDKNYSVRFAYDATLDDNQPPGFRDLNLSKTTETGNR